MSDLLAQLNPSQIKAVQHIDGPLLILAGAGSGKTRTLTTRLAYLIDQVGVPPTQTLTLTFTNKASQEMHHRALSLMSQTLPSPPLLCTFHRFGLMFLKFYIHLLGREHEFVLLDADDRKKILKKLSDEVSVGYAEHMISQYKNTLITPELLAQQAKDRHQKALSRIYESYQRTLLEQNLIDFDDLILLPYLILEGNASLAQEVSTRYAYIMVDEYQDTNFLQFCLLQKLCAAHQNICVVGDDDQSIYSWRGADIRNILDFQEHFKGAEMIKLEDNYRSTEQILHAANTLIAHNSTRLGKVLRSNNGEGEPVEIMHHHDEAAESLGIAKSIKTLLKKGVQLDEIAILFRVNALSRSIEEGLNKEKIPYKLLGTIRFYERAEIKDILSYLRYLVNPKDDFSLERIINQPKRGIGVTTQEKMFSLAKMRSKSVYEAFCDGDFVSVVSEKNLSTLREFFGILQNLREFLERPSLLLEHFFEQIDLLQAYDKSQEATDRVGNIEEFVGLLRDYFVKNPDDLLQDFLNNIPLHSDLDTTEEGAVKCMSVHTAKGLEFDYVFVMGMENGFFPLLREESDLEEERRLAYVAFTRAKKQLFISRVDSRFYRGKRTQLEKSQFLKEAGLLARPNGGGNSEGEISAGDEVLHKVFGIGRVESVQQGGILSINFGGSRRQIMANFVQKV